MTESLEDMLIRHEGMVLHAYTDSEGYLTIGVGRLIDKRLNGGITEEEARYLLRNDIQKVVAQAKQFPWYDKLSNPRKQVVLNMIFNLGITRFSQFRKTIGFIANGDYTAAAKEMLDSKWAKQVGKRATELAEIMERGE